ncbi:MAG: sugar phosphate isomerase/epimerase [Candidatus Bathyarchaeota archaeon]|nr:sugar phosphate isomerase/epimerase [Candidatus Bathyarchaeota archaeon]MCX8176941.1 sugar phosphate isomerase/epimerase [Candidatus Bathyarchaeota archaeon]MDW8193372.1 sugar phosphate isomerase/epimerase family protein [Nitrososphaerota archaeon]
MAKPKIGLSLLYKLGEPFDKGLMDAVMKNVKFIEIVDDGIHALDKRKISMLMDVGKSYGLSYSVHAPFADINIASPSKNLLSVMIKRLRRSMEYACALGAYLWVFHPGLKTGISSFYPGAEWLQNIRSVQLLYKYSKIYGVKVAIENLPEPYPFLMKSVEEFQRFYDEIGEAADLGFALDVGHANINGQIELFIEEFRDKLVHVHVHDNHGKEDQHLGIGYGKVNWKSFTDALKHVSYDRTVVVESVEHVSESLQQLERLLL